MDNLAIAVKSFIVNEKEELLLIKRRDNDPHSPGVWEIPGGRLAMGENPFDGIKRETKEETNLDIEVKEPLGIHYFTRDDGQKITMIVFLCNPLSNDVKLSQEHTEFKWIPVEEANEIITSAFQKEVNVFRQYFSKPM